MAEKKSARQTSRSVKPRAKKAASARPSRKAWNLRLYVAGRSPRSRTAVANLERLCEEHIPGRYSIEIVDLLLNPQLAKADQILAIPTLVRKLPVPVKRLIGDLSNAERAMVALDLRQLPG